MGIRLLITHIFLPTFLTFFWLQMSENHIILDRRGGEDTHNKKRKPFHIKVFKSGQGGDTHDKKHYCGR